MFMSVFYRFQLGPRKHFFKVECLDFQLAPYLPECLTSSFIHVQTLIKPLQPIHDVVFISCYFLLQTIGLMHITWWNGKNPTSVSPWHLMLKRLLIGVFLSVSCRNLGLERPFLCGWKHCSKSSSYKCLQTSLAFHEETGKACVFSPFISDFFGTIEPTTTNCWCIPGYPFESNM